MTDVEEASTVDVLTSRQVLARVGHGREMAAERQWLTKLGAKSRTFISAQINALTLNSGTEARGLLCFKSKRGHCCEQVDFLTAERKG